MNVSFKLTVTPRDDSWDVLIANPLAILLP